MIPLLAAAIKFWALSNYLEVARTLSARFNKAFVSILTLVLHFEQTILSFRLFGFLYVMRGGFGKNSVKIDVFSMWRCAFLRIVTTYIKWHLKNIGPQTSRKAEYSTQLNIDTEAEIISKTLQLAKTNRA